MNSLDLYPVQNIKSLIKADGFYYIASPYTSPSKQIIGTRVSRARRIVGLLVEAGIFCFSPIIHCHQLAREHDLPTDFTFWLNYNKVFMDASIGTIVCEISGYDTSKGVKQEIEYTKASGKPLFLARVRRRELLLDRA